MHVPYTQAIKKHGEEVENNNKQVNDIMRKFAKESNENRETSWLVQTKINN